MEKKYIRYASPNKARFAALLDQARGTRTMKKFADDCGVNPSTFSRIYNQANKGASSEELIRVIAEHADPESGVTLDMLMEANGLIPEGSRLAARELQEHLEEETTSVLYDRISDLLDSDSEIYSEQIRYPIAKSMSMRPDLVVDNICIDGKKGQWLIDIMPSTVGLSTTGGNFDDRRFNFFLARRVQERIGRYLGAYCMLPEDGQIVRISLVVYDEQIYELILDHYGKMKSNDSISFILVDLENRKIEEEYVLADRKGQRGSSLFSCKQEDDEEKFNEDFDGLFWDDDSEE